MKLISKYNLTLFFVIYFLYTFVANFVHPVTPAFLQLINCSNSMFGFAYAAMALGQFLVSALWGKVGDRIGYAKATAIGFLGYGASAIVFSMATSWHLVLAGRLMGGIAIASISVNSMAYIAALDAPAEDRNSLLVIYSSMMAIGGAFGFMVGGLIGDINLYYSFYAQASVLFAMTAITYFMIKEHPTFIKSEKKLTLRDVNPLTSTIASMKLLNVTISVFLLSSLLTYFASTGFDQNFNYFLRAKFNFAPSSSGMFKAVVGVISLTINMTLNLWLVKKFNISKAMCSTVMLAGASMFGVVMAPSQTSVMVFALMYYAFYAMYIPLQQAVMLKNGGTSSKGTVSALFNTAKSFGMMTGPTFAGLIFDINPNYAFATFGFALVLAAAIGYVNYIQLKNTGIYEK